MTINRRTFSALLASAVAAPRMAFAQAKVNTAFYSGVGGQLTHFEIDFGAATLVKRASVTLPGGLQYAWPHPSRRYLYVATSSGGVGIAPVPGYRARPTLSPGVPRRPVRRSFGPWRPDQVETAADPSERGQCRRTCAGRVQLPLQCLRVQDQGRRRHRRRGEAAGQSGEGHLLPSDPRDARRQIDPHRGARQQSGRDASRKTRARCTSTGSRTACCRTGARSRRTAATASVRATSTFTRRSRGSTCRSSGRTS